MEVRELITVLGFEIEDEKLKELDSKIGFTRIVIAKLEQDITSFGRSLQKFGFGLTAFVTAPLAILSGVMIKSASDAIESQNKFDVVFRNIKEGANELAESFAKDFDLAKSTAIELLGSTADLATGFGFTQEQALKLSERANRLAGDLASFQNIQGGVEEAGRRLTRGILGETENLKLMGIAVNQGDKEFRKLVKDISKTQKITERQARVVAILNIAYEQSKNAIGDYNRTQKEFANQLRKASELIKTIAIQFGTLLIPVANVFLKILIKILKVIEIMPRWMKILITSFAVFISIVGPAILIVGTIIASFGFLILKIAILKSILGFFGLSLIKILTVWGAKLSLILFKYSALRIALVVIFKFMGVFLLKFAAVIAIISAVGVAIGLIIEDFSVWAKGGDSAIGLILGNFEVMKRRVLFVLRTIRRAFQFFWIAISTGNQDMWDEFKNQDVILGEAFDRLFEKALDKLEEIGPKIAEIFSKAFIKIRKMPSEIIFEISKRLITSIGNLITFVMTDITNTFIKEIDRISKKIPFLNRILNAESGSMSASESKKRAVRLMAMPAFGVLSSGIFSGGAKESKTTVTENNFKLETSIDLKIPEGTSRFQENFIKTKVKSAFNEALTKSINQAILSNPKREK